MSLIDERKELEKNKESLKAARTAINNKFIELGGAASTSFNDVPEKTTELANTITATNKTYIDSKTGDLNNLQTQDKTNLVNAINEVKTGLASATPSDYEQVKADVEKLKSDVGTARTNLINSINSTIDNL